MSDLVCFFDTETTGLPRRGAPLEQQPRIVQLAASLQGPGGVERGAFKVLVQPLGWSIPDDVAAIHRITTGDCRDAGLPISVALGMLSQLCRLSGLQVAHNAKFDREMIDLECERLGKSGPLQNLRCTAERSTPVLCLPPTQKMLDAGRTHHKTPNLGECIAHLFGETLEGAHDAMVDVRACARVWWELERREQAANPKLI